MAATTLSLVVPVPFYLLPPPESLRRRPVTAGSADSLREGQGRNIIYGDRPAVVVRIGGAFRAFSRVCTHRGCGVNWEPDPGRFDCPCHGAEFDDQGRPVTGPAKEPLESLPCRVGQKGEIIVG